MSDLFHRDVPVDFIERVFSVMHRATQHQFKILTKRHLAMHGMDAAAYREKWGFKKDTPLVCKALQRERRRKMKDMKLWEKRRKAQ